MATFDEINTLAFVLMKVLVVTAPRKKQGYVSLMFIVVHPYFPTSQQVRLNAFGFTLLHVLRRLLVSGCTDLLKQLHAAALKCMLSAEPSRSKRATQATQATKQAAIRTITMLKYQRA